MDVNKLIAASIKLRRKLFAVISEFWAENKDLPMEEIFFINSAVFSSLLAQITHSMFKKNGGNDKQLEYIEQVCSFAKEQYKEGKSRY